MATALGSIIGVREGAAIFVTGGVLLAGALFFLRNPSRDVPKGEHTIVSPADGKVADIQKYREPGERKAGAWRVGIFLSILDVHMNRMPCAGRVAYQVHTKGAFAPAYKKRAAAINENNAIGITGTLGEIRVKQIAGVVARRVVSWVKVGQQVEKGELFGMIRFGSRTEIYLPETFMLKVKVGDRVKAGESVIGEWGLAGKA
jgi:phosphatidylserine decarboxylase